MEYLANLCEYHEIKKYFISFGMLYKNHVNIFLTYG